MVFQKVEQIAWKQASELNISERNEGGFGHTGTH